MRPSLSRSISDAFRRHREALRIKSRSIAAHAQVEPKLGVPDTINIPPPSVSARGRIEPHSLVASELSYIQKCLLNLLGTSHPGLADAAQYYFLQPSKQIRSLVVLLFARATNGFGRNWDQKNWEAVCETRTDRLATFDDPLSRSDVLNEWNPSMPDHTTSFESVFLPHQPTTRPSYPPLQPPSNLTKNLFVRPPSLLPTQIRLAQIVEMVHIASLLHDSISSTAEQGNPNFFTQGHGFGNKIAILGGDFLLGRASWALSQLGESEVVELVASVISNQVEGQFLQMDQIQALELGSYPPPDSLSDAWDRYSRGLYLKTASLMAKAARSAVILGGCPEGNILREVAYLYGRNLGIAFQVRQAIFSRTRNDNSAVDGRRDTCNTASTCDWSITFCVRGVSKFIATNTTQLGQARGQRTSKLGFLSSVMILNTLMCC